MADQLPIEEVKRISHSFKFQRMLKLNPALARQAAQGRDKMALEFLRSEALQNGSHTYAAKVLEGYDPLKPPVATEVHID